MNVRQRSDHERRPDQNGIATVPPTSVERVLRSMQRVVGRKWHPIIVYHLLRESPQGFNGLKDSIEDVSSKMLSESLSELEELGIVDRTIASEKPVRVEYELTAEGQALETVVTGMIRWGRDCTTVEPEPSGP
jgi:DNA-binding HxlR family transcriptional regulator